MSAPYTGYNLTPRKNYISIRWNLNTINRYNSSCSNKRLDQSILTHSNEGKSSNKWCTWRSRRKILWKFVIFQPFETTRSMMKNMAMQSGWKDRKNWTKSFSQLCRQQNITSALLPSSLFFPEILRIDEETQGFFFS